MIILNKTKWIRKLHKSQPPPCLEPHEPWSWTTDPKSNGQFWNHHRSNVKRLSTNSNHKQMWWQKSGAPLLLDPSRFRLAPPPVVETCKYLPHYRQHRCPPHPCEPHLNNRSISGMAFDLADPDRLTRPTPNHVARRSPSVQTQKRVPIQPVRILPLLLQTFLLSIPKRTGMKLAEQEHPQCSARWTAASSSMSMWPQAPPSKTQWTVLRKHQPQQPPPWHPGLHPYLPSVQKLGWAGTSSANILWVPPWPSKRHKGWTKKAPRAVFKATSTLSLKCTRLGSRAVVWNPGGVHSWHRRFKHHQNSTIRPPREGKMKENCGGRVKKERKFGRSWGGRAVLGRASPLPPPSIFVIFQNFNYNYNYKYNNKCKFKHDYDYTFYFNYTSQLQLYLQI